MFTTTRRPLNLVYDKSRDAVGINVAFDGDSVTAGFGIPSTDRYSSQLQNRYSRTWAASNNFAVSGSKVAGLASRASQVDAVLSSTARVNVLCVMIGINDLYNAGGVGDAPSAVWTALKAYLAARRTAGWKLVLGTPTVVIGSGGRFTQYETDRQTLINLIKSEPTQYDVLAPTGDNFFIGNPNAPAVSTIFQDGAHPTRDGSTVYANIFEESIKELLVKVSNGTA